MVQQKQKCAATSAESESTGKRKVTVGSFWESNNYGKFEVLSYRGSLEVLIKFADTGYETTVCSSEIRKGKVKDKKVPSVVGIGFVGDGNFSPYTNGRASRPYSVWQGMLRRCYSEKQQDNQPTYKQCTVFEGWHNFQNFAEWFVDKYPCDGKDYALDKDLKVIGNKVYSPCTCMFVTQSVNSFIVDCKSSRGRFMIGASYSLAAKKFISHCSNLLVGEKEYLGSFNTELEAHLAWRKRKSELAYELAMTQDREEVKQALLNWKEALDSNIIHPY